MVEWLSLVILGLILVLVAWYTWLAYGQVRALSLANQVLEEHRVVVMRALWRALRRSSRSAMARELREVLVTRRRDEPPEPEGGALALVH